MHPTASRDTDCHVLYDFCPNSSNTLHKTKHHGSESAGTSQVLHTCALLGHYVLPYRHAGKEVRNDPEERSSAVLRGTSLKSRIVKCLLWKVDGWTHIDIYRYMLRYEPTSRLPT